MTTSTITWTRPSEGLPDDETNVLIAVRTAAGKSPVPAGLTVFPRTTTRASPSGSLADSTLAKMFAEHSPQPSLWPKFPHFLGN